jgi:hypothetical protein
MIMSLMKPVVLAVASAALLLTALAGCATAYQSKGFTGGYSESQLSDNVFRVYFRGNAKTTAERAEDFTLLRSAELAQDHGFPYFIVVDENSVTEVMGTYNTPTQTNTTATATAVGNTAYGTSHSATSGSLSMHIRKPSDRMTVVCFRDKPSVDGMVYESRFVVGSIRSKYGMQPHS